MPSASFTPPVTEQSGDFLITGHEPKAHIFKKKKRKRQKNPEGTENLLANANNMMVLILHKCTCLFTYRLNIHLVFIFKEYFFISSY